MTDTGTFHFNVENFDKIYRGEPNVDGGPASSGIPWDVHVAQPVVMELEALGGISGGYRCLHPPTLSEWAPWLSVSARYPVIVHLR
jgi:hypothetical protein